MLVFLVILASVGEPVRITVDLQLPIPECEPELLVWGETSWPTDKTIIIRKADYPGGVVIPTESSCRLSRWLCVTWKVACDKKWINIWGIRHTAPKDSTYEETRRHFIFIEAGSYYWFETDPIHCTIESHPTALGDLDGDCWTTPADVAILAKLKAWNRLKVFQAIQNEWPR